MAFRRGKQSGDSPVRERVYRDVQATSARGGRIALATAIVSVGTLLLVAAYSAYQVSEPRRTTTLIERGVIAITDIDIYLAETLPALRTAAAANDGDLVALPGYPIDIRLSQEELRTASDAEIRALVLRRSSAAVYDRGLAAFASRDGQSLGFVTAENAADSFLSLLRGSMHERAGALALACALAVAIGAAMIAASDLRPGVLRTLGGAMLGGSLTGLGLAFLLGVLLGRAGGDDVFSREIAAIVESTFDVPRRNFLVASVFSALLFGAGWVLTVLERRAAARGAKSAEGAWWDDEAGAEFAYDMDGDFQAVDVAPPPGAR